jgi:hypothetical protein
MVCYSDHNEDIRVTGSCDYCHDTTPDSAVPATPSWVHQLRSVGFMRPRRLSETWSCTLVAETPEAEIFIAEAIAPTSSGAVAIAEVLSRALMSYAGVKP